MKIFNELKAFFRYRELMNWKGEETRLGTLILQHCRARGIEGFSIPTDEGHIEIIRRRG